MRVDSPARGGESEVPGSSFDPPILHILHLPPSLCSCLNYSVYFIPRLNARLRRPPTGRTNQAAASVVWCSIVWLFESSSSRVLNFAECLLSFCRERFNIFVLYSLSLPTSTRSNLHDSFCFSLLRTRRRHHQPPNTHKYRDVTHILLKSQHLATSCIMISCRNTKFKCTPYRLVMRS